MAKHNDFGKDGERIAADYLKSKGYVVHHCNWRDGHKELDIVAQERDTLVVVEVKTRASTTFGDASDAVTPAKIRRIVTATDYYVNCYCIDLPVRFDVITIIGEGKESRLEHIIDAFYPPLG